MNGMIQKSPGPRVPRYLPSRNTIVRSHWLAIFGDWASNNPNNIQTTAYNGLFAVAVQIIPIMLQAMTMIALMKFSRGRETERKCRSASERGLFFSGRLKLKSIFLYLF